MEQQGNLKLKCQQDDHLVEIETICYNQFCKDFRLNCFKCNKKGRIHHDHLDDVEKLNSLIGFIENKNKECDNLIDDLNTYVESLNESFSQLKRGIRQKCSLQKERLINLKSQQIHDYLNSTIKLIEYKQSIITVISDQTKKLTNTFNNLYEQLQLSSFNYYQIDDNSIKLSKELYKKGFDLYTKDKYGEALGILDFSIHQNCHNYQSLSCKGTCLRKLKKYEDAIGWLDKALSIDPKNVDSLFEKSQCLRKINKYEDAIIWIVKALAINNKDVNSLLVKGQCLILLREYDDSISWLDKALAIDPKHVNSLYQKGVCLILSKQYEDAIRWLDNTLVISPKHVNSYFRKMDHNIINRCMSKKFKKYEYAITWMDQTLAIDPKHINSLYQKDIRLLNQCEDSISWLDKELAINLNHYFSLSEKGECLRILKKYNESLLDQALSINPKNTFSLQTKEKVQEINDNIKKL